MIIIAVAFGVIALTAKGLEVLVCAVMVFKAINLSFLASVIIDSVVMNNFGFLVLVS